jgi:putative YphP/YqiW family bacilliredoxin
MYPEELVAPMRKDLSSIGFEELKSPEAVDMFLSQPGTSLVVFNSVCGCAAGSARPGVKKAILESTHKPNHIGTVFAGVDKEAVARAREHALPFPPSSPSIALFKNGEVIHFVERHHIEGRTADMIATHLKMVFDELCQ